MRGGHDAADLEERRRLPPVSPSLQSDAPDVDGLLTCPRCTQVDSGRHAYASLRTHQQQGKIPIEYDKMDSWLSQKPATADDDN
jgi:hypothetical protein